MKNLKVGQSFEVVEVLSDGGYSDESLLKINGVTVAYENSIGFQILVNGHNIHNYKHYLHMYKHEVKPIGKLTITKLKH